MSATERPWFMHINNLKLRFGMTYASTMTSGTIKDNTRRIFVSMFFFIRLDWAKTQSLAISSNKGTDEEIHAPNVILKANESNAWKILSLLVIGSANCMLRASGRKHETIATIKTKKRYQIICSANHLRLITRALSSETGQQTAKYYDSGHNHIVKNRIVSEVSACTVRCVQLCVCTYREYRWKFFLGSRRIE